MHLRCLTKVSLPYGCDVEHALHVINHQPRLERGRAVICTGIGPPPGTRSDMNVLFGHLVDAFGDSLHNLLRLHISRGGFSTPPQNSEFWCAPDSIGQISPCYLFERISLVREELLSVPLVPVFFLFPDYIDCSAHITSCGTKRIRCATKVALPYGKRLNKDEMEKIGCPFGRSGLYMYFREVGIVQGVQTPIECVYYLDPT